MEDFARYLGDELNKAITSMQFSQEIDAGIGVHFTAYEYMSGYWIPELFALSNFMDTSYAALWPDGIHVNRETCNIVAQELMDGHFVIDAPAYAISEKDEMPQLEHRDVACRLFVRQFLQQHGILLYNNGDPLMFNSVANGIFTAVWSLQRHSKLRGQDDIETYRAMAKMPVHVVCKTQDAFAQKETRLAGGKIHDLVIRPTGEMSSSSGDV